MNGHTNPHTHLPFALSAQDIDSPAPPSHRRYEEDPMLDAAIRLLVDSVLLGRTESARTLAEVVSTYCQEGRIVLATDPEINASPLHESEKSPIQPSRVD